jgi:hypothetical protein
MNASAIVRAIVQEYADGERLPEPSLRDDAAFVAVEERVVAALREAGNWLVRGGMRQR